MHPASPAPEIRLGTTVQGEFHIEALLDPEELGPLYEAENSRRKARFRLLMLRREISPPLKTMLAVRNDLRRAQALAPQGLMPIEQVADDTGVAGYATEVLPGQTLRQCLDSGPLPPERALALCGVIGQALQAAHQAGLVHGDLRPDNVLLVQPTARRPFGGRALLLGHSLWRLRPPRSVAAARLPYCAPEHLLGGASPGGDVFALGALLYECLTGQPAFSGADEAALRARLQEPPPLLPEGDALGHGLNILIAAACSPEPRTRLPGMGEFVDALRQAATGAGLSWPEADTGSRQISIVRRLGLMLGTRPRPAPEPAPLPPPPVAEAPAPPVETFAPPPSRPSARPPPPPRPPPVAVRPTQPIGQVWQRERTLPLVSTGSRPRSARPSDVTRLIIDVQRGRLDPSTAVHRAHFGEALRRRPEILAAVLGAVGVGVLALLFALLR